MAKILVLALGASVVAAAISSAGAGAGDPARGALVWATAGCGACHAFARAGSSGAGGGSAPNLDRYLIPDARRARLPTDRFVFGRVYWGGRGMPAYGATLTGEELDDLVSFVVGRPFSAPPEKAVPVPPLPAPPPLVTASRTTVARWVKAGRLPLRAARGAALFARLGCLSCHAYRGSGQSRRGGRDLTAAGRGGRRASFFVGYVSRPYRSGNNLMPSYADLTANDLGRIAAFLAASRGLRP